MFSHCRDERLTGNLRLFPRRSPELEDAAVELVLVRPLEEEWVLEPERHLGFSVADAACSGMDDDSTPLNLSDRERGVCRRRRFWNLEHDDRDRSTDVHLDQSFHRRIVAVRLVGDPLTCPGAFEKLGVEILTRYRRQKGDREHERKQDRHDLFHCDLLLVFRDF